LLLLSSDLIRFSVPICDDIRPRWCRNKRSRHEAGEQQICSTSFCLVTSLSKPPVCLSQNRLVFLPKLIVHCVPPSRQVCPNAKWKKSRRTTGAHFIRGQN